MKIFITFLFGVAICLCAIGCGTIGTNCVEECTCHENGKCCCKGICGDCYCENCSCGN